MQSFDREQFASLLKEQRIRPRLARELSFVPETVADWNNIELLSVSTRAENEGLLLVQTDGFYLLHYELTRGMTDKLTGRSKPVTCDFCYTWQ